MVSVSYSQFEIQNALKIVFFYLMINNSNVIGQEDVIIYYWKETDSRRCVKVFKPIKLFVSYLTHTFIRPPTSLA